MREIIEPTDDNDEIVGQVLADRIKTARAKRYPSAEDILENLGNTKVIFK